MENNNLEFYEKNFIEALDEYVFILNDSGEIRYVNNMVLKEFNCDLEYINKINFFEASSFTKEDFFKNYDKKVSEICLALGDKKVCLNNISILKKSLEHRECYMILGKKEKRMFMMDISHELKTPINIILSTIQLLKSNIDNGNITYNKDVNLPNYLDSIKKNSFKILKLVNTIMDINKIEEGYYKVNNEKCEIVKTIEDIVQSVIKYGEVKNLEIVFDTNVEEKFILCDIEKIEHILLNLLSNSIKYTNEGGKVQVYLEVLENSFQVSVKDNGIGIHKNNLNMIFDRFYQVDKDKSLLRKSKGSGVGLFLVESLVKIQNGTIKCISELDEGSEFIFKIPTIECEKIDKFSSHDLGFYVNEYFEM